MTETDQRERQTSPVLRPEVLAHLSQLGSTRHFPQSEVIFTHGDRGSGMYVVEDGEVELSFAAGQDVKRLRTGEFFGELALITGDHVRTGTAVAATPVRLRVLDQRSFDALLRRAPTVSVELLRRTCAYLLQSEQRLVADLTRRNQELEHTLDYLRRTREDLDATQLISLTDELTGLYNRRCLNHQRDTLMARAAEDDGRIALILIDIDHFKEVNDRLGHPVGDLVLKRFAAALRCGLRQTDLPCRVGGDEFAVLLTGSTAAEGQRTARRLLESMAALDIRVGPERLAVGCSMGGTALRPGESWDDFYARCDHSLYLAKAGGRNRAAWDEVVIAVSGEPPTT